MDHPKEDSKQPSKTSPVPQLDQNHSDFALAMALQEQERPFSLESDDIASNDDEEEEEEESEFSYDDEHYEFFDSSENQGELEFLDQEMEYIDQLEEEEEEDEIDPDDLSYEELLALGEVVGKENIGLSQDEVMGCLRLCPWKIGCSSIVERKSGIVDCCVICQMEYEDGEDLVALVACEHPYHFDCINKWLLIKKTCPICNSDVSPPSADDILTSATN